MSKKFLLVLAALSWMTLSARSVAETVTLPVAASTTGVGGVPFVSDVRVFNTSYTDVLAVTAVYRFNGQTRVFQLAPREARAFDDIGVSLFGSPGSVGAVEFTTSGSTEDLVVSSQLRSPVAAGGFVGMFIPGLPPSSARAVTVLPGLVNGDSRTNIGVYNPNGTAVTATIRLYDGAVLLGTKPVGLGAHAGTQVSNIYNEVGFGSLVRSNGYATVESSDAGSPLFTYAAEADNKSGDLLLIVGARDSTAPPGFHAPTATTTPVSGGTSPTPTPTPGTSATTIIVNVGQSGNNFSPSTAVIRVGDTVRWDFMDALSNHSTTSGTCVFDPSGYGGYVCSPFPSGLNWDSGELHNGDHFSQLFMTPGSYRYYCSVHGYMMTGTIQVNP
jgi:plastocyanin